MYIGTDIVEIEKIKKGIANWERGFLNLVFTEQEISSINAEDPNYERAAGFWAAKESMVKAIGLGFRDGICFHDMDIHHDEYGCPYFILSGCLKQKIEKMGIKTISVSISHCRTHAIAVVAIANTRVT